MCPRAKVVKNLHAMQDTQVWSLGWEDPLEKGMATHSSIPAWRIPIDRGAWWATVHGVTRVGHKRPNDWTTTSALHTSYYEFYKH